MITPDRTGCPHRAGFSVRCVVGLVAVLRSATRIILSHLRGLGWPGASRRARAALTALVFVAASLLGALHEATTSHVRCAVHGELVDSAAPLGVVAGPARATIASAQPLARAHGDEHCLLASMWRSPPISPRPPSLVAAVAVSHDVVVAAPGIAQASASLYRIAPKTSPPA